MGAWLSKYLGYDVTTIDILKVQAAGNFVGQK